MLHRDIKPSNLLLDAVGNVWVTDFGLAKFEEGEDLSQSQDLVGTLRYMAPERFRGVSDRRCDVYALGATLYELLTLRPVFESADRLRLIDQIVHEPPAPPRQLDRRIPRDLETIVLKALAKDPKDRFATADELAAELRRFLENRPIRSRPISASERLWRWCKRNPAVAALTALAAALTIFIAIGSTVAAWTFREQRDDAPVRARPDQGEPLAGPSTPSTKAQLGAGQVAAVRGRGPPAHRADRPAVRQPGPARQGRAGPGCRSRGPEAIARDPQPCDRRPGTDRPARAPAARLRRRLRLQRRCRPGAVCRRRALRRRSSCTGWTTTASWSACRARTSAISGTPGLSSVRTASCWSPATPGWRGRSAADVAPGTSGAARQPAEPGTALAFHPDGRRLLFGAPEGGIAVWDRVERRVVRRLPLDFAPHHLALDPEGRRLAVNNADAAAPRVAILELETGRVLADWRSQVGNSTLAWSADGQLLAVGSDGDDSRVYVWNVRRGELASVLQGHTAMIINAQFAHTGYLLATTS